MSCLKKHVRNYTQVANDIINDNRLSLKAKGLFLFLVSKPDNWSFSARLIASQNKDQIASVNATLQDLEDYGLLLRVPCQGGYDYEIFDTVQSHLVENRLSGKSTKRQPKIDLVENRPSISNKEPLAKREERENSVSTFSHLVINQNYADLFIDQLSSSRLVKNKLAYRSSIRSALFNESHPAHAQTLFAYRDFVNSLSLSSVKKLPDGVDVFSFYENME